MKTTLQRLSLISHNDLTTPSSTQSYALGERMDFIDDETKEFETYIYIKAHTGLIAYKPYVVSYSATANAEVISAAPATIAAPGVYVVYPQVAFTSGYFGWALLKGNGKALKTAETYVSGDMLQLLNAGTALVVDGTSGSTTYSINTCAICKTTGSAAATINIYATGERAVIAAT